MKIPITIVLIVLLTGSLYAQDARDIAINGLELEKVLSFLNGIIAFILFIVTFLAYHRDNRKKFLLISLAFFLFSLKSFLVSLELFIPEIPLIDPISIVLEFLVIILFFSGVLGRGG